jgi:hypothetical protein
VVPVPPGRTAGHDEGQQRHALHHRHPGGGRGKAVPCTTSQTSRSLVIISLEVIGIPVLK